MFITSNVRLQLTVKNKIKTTTFGHKSFKLIRSGNCFNFQYTNLTMFVVFA